MVDCCLCIDLTLLDLKPKRLVGFWGMQMLGIPTGAPRRPRLWTSSGSWRRRRARRRDGTGRAWAFRGSRWFLLFMWGHVLKLTHSPEARAREHPSRSQRT